MNYLAFLTFLLGQLDSGGQPRKANIGLVGYPNVGKSSTINALVGAKCVAVGSTPGKTKHFQASSKKTCLIHAVTICIRAHRQFI